VSSKSSSIPFGIATSPVCPTAAGTDLKQVVARWSDDDGAGPVPEHVATEVCVVAAIDSVHGPHALRHIAGTLELSDAGAPTRRRPLAALAITHANNVVGHTAHDQPAGAIGWAATHIADALDRRSISDDQLTNAMSVWARLGADWPLSMAVAAAVLTEVVRCCDDAELISACLEGNPRRGRHRRRVAARRAGLTDLAGQLP